MKYVAYNTKTGDIRQTGECPDYEYDNLVVTLMNVMGWGVIPGNADPLTEMVVDGETVSKPAHVIDAESVERMANEARQHRNALLTISDWTQGKDISDEVSQLWQPYRQALRDVPGQAGFPNDINWPVAP